MNLFCKHYCMRTLRPLCISLEGRGILGLKQVDVMGNICKWPNCKLSVVLKHHFSYLDTETKVCLVTELKMNMGHFVTAAEIQIIIIIFFSDVFGL